MPTSPDILEPIDGRTAPEAGMALPRGNIHIDLHRRDDGMVVIQITDNGNLANGSPVRSGIMGNGTGTVVRHSQITVNKLWHGTGTYRESAVSHALAGGQVQQITAPIIKGNIDCIEKGVFGSNDPWPLQVQAGDYCLLLHYEYETLLALWQATTPGGKRLVPKAWGGKFPFQVRVALRTTTIIELPKGTLGMGERIVEGERAEQVLQQVRVISPDFAPHKP